MQRLNSSSARDKERIIHYLYHYFANYNELCVRYLKEIVKQEKEKKKIESALKCYLTTLLNCGYSQEYIYHFNNKIFGNQEISSMEILDEFLNRFDFQKRKYKVYIALNKKAKQFKDILESRLGANLETDYFSEKLKINSDEYIHVGFEIEALDENKAAQEVYENVNLFIRFYKFLGNRREEWFFNKCLVRDENNDYVIIELKPVGYSYSEDYDDRTIGMSSEVLISALINNAHNTFHIVDKVLQIHNTAIENPDMKNSFLNMWSILEIIGISKRDDSKMAEIECSVVPILQKEYAINIFKELHDYIKANISETKYEEIMQRICIDKDDYVKIACLVILDQYKEERQELCSVLTNYPVIRSRIFQLNDMFNKKINYYNELERYSKRVKWHLRRMYRTRNAIIHSGDNPTNLKYLGEHLHSYIDEILYEITAQLAKDARYSTIDNVVISTELIIDEIKKQFHSKEETEYVDILSLYTE